LEQLRRGFPASQPVRVLEQLVATERHWIRLAAGQDAGHLDRSRDDPKKQPASPVQKKF
jgi:hypothetical protein